MREIGDSDKPIEALSLPSADLHRRFGIGEASNVPRPRIWGARIVVKVQDAPTASCLEWFVETSFICVPSVETYRIVTELQQAVSFHLENSSTLHRSSAFTANPNLMTYS